MDGKLDKAMKSYHNKQRNSFCQFEGVVRRNKRIEDLQHDNSELKAGLGYANNIEDSGNSILENLSAQTDTLKGIKRR